MPRITIGPRRTSTPNLRVAFINACGFAIASASTTFIDSRLTTHYYWKRARVYPLGYWIAIYAVVPWAATLWAMSRTEKRKSLAAWLPSAVLAIPCLWYFRPEFPHLGFTLDIASYSLLSFVTWELHQTIARGPGRHGSLSAQRSRAEESVKDWRGVLFFAASSYLVLAIYWLQLIWTVVDKTVEAPGERWLLGSVMTFKFVFYSILVLAGPLGMVYRIFKALQDEWPGLPRENA